MFRKLLSLTVVVSFFLTSLSPIPQAHADTVFGLPQPGSMVNLSPAYEPVIIKGLTVHKDNPFLFDFIVDVGQDKMSGEPLKKEGEKLIKYFLASLAIPDKDLWVNLSPYEKNRMIPEALGQTDMGRDLLEQDYILKQITASLIYPEKQLGKIFWDKVYAKAQQMYGTTQIPVNTFNKVWIMADNADVFEHNQTAFVVSSHLKVMLEEDYLALQKHQLPAPNVTQGNSQPTNILASQIVRQIILPELEKEVNTGKNFANLRQIFNSVILSTWYKKNLKEALLNQVYADQSKVKGINLNDPTVKEQIYEQYLKAYKKGVFNYIKEELGTSGETVPRKYFSGGTVVGMGNRIRFKDLLSHPAEYSQSLPATDRLVEMGTALTSAPPSAAMIKPLQQASGNGLIVEIDRGEKKIKGTVNRLVALALHGEEPDRALVKQAIIMGHEGLEKPHALYKALLAGIDDARKKWEGTFHVRTDTSGKLHERYWRLLNSSSGDQFEKFKWDLFEGAWELLQTYPAIAFDYKGLIHPERASFKNFLRKYFSDFLTDSFIYGKETFQVVPFKAQAGVEPLSKNPGSILIPIVLTQSPASAAMTVVVNYENGTWDISIGDKKIQTVDPIDLGNKLEAALSEGVSIKVADFELEINLPSGKQYKVDSKQPQYLQETIEAIIAGRQTIENNKGASTREPIVITNESFPILSPAIKTEGNVAESSLKVRLTSKYALTTDGDLFKSVVMGTHDGKTDFELARQIIQAGNIDPKKEWAQDQWYALKLFVAMRFVLYEEFNTPSGEQYIPNSPVETIIINYLGADPGHRDRAKFARRSLRLTNTIRPIAK